tara:strand:- start:244 stop:816 length:573 start_codon:yes stop_codon:yes gene_type:complete
MSDQIGGVESGDILLVPNQGTGTTGPAPASEVMDGKIDNILLDRPIASFILPSGKMLEMYAKSEGQLARIDTAFQDWLSAALKSDRRIKLRSRRFWRRPGKADRALGEMQLKKAEFFRRIFEDLYIESRHVDLDASDFLALDLATQGAIVDAFRSGNDAIDIISAMMPSINSDKKKEDLRSAISPVGTHI